MILILNYMIGKIREAIDNNEKVLTKYKAAFAEIQRYVDGCPHQGQDNLAEVEKYIKIVIQIDASINIVGEQISLIEPFCDRHQKGSVVIEYVSMQKKAYDHFVCENFEQFKNSFDNIMKKVQDVLTAFDQEEDELIQLQSSLDNLSPDMWKEDNERLVSLISNFLDENLTQVQFDIEEIKEEIMRAKDKRGRDILRMTKENPWLKSDKYRGFHEGLISRYISYSEYKSSIEIKKY